MTRLWLHCGTFKTGTSRIQDVVWRHRDDLPAQGWLYPQTGLVLDEPDAGHRHSPLVYQFRDPSVWEPLLDELVAEIRASSATDVLLSAEGWSRPWYGHSLVALIARLRAAGVIDAEPGSVRGVLYVRNRCDYARALYREFVRRRGNRLAFPEFVHAFRRPLDTVEAVTTVAAAVDELTVTPYEDAGDVAHHFAGLLGLRIPIDDGGRANVSLDAVDGEALRQLNLLAPDLVDAWPGARPRPGRYAEKPTAGQLDPDAQWRTDFQEVTGWSPAQVDRMLAPTLTDVPDPTSLTGELHGEVLDWLAAAAQPVVDVVTHPHPAVEEFSVGNVEPASSKPWLSGFLLLRPGERLGRDGWQLIGVDDFREREIAVDRPSPGFAQRHPGRAEATAARWGSPYLTYGLHGRLDLHLEHADGQRAVLATIRRRWELR